MFLCEILMLLEHFKIKEKRSCKHKFTTKDQIKEFEDSSQQMFSLRPRIQTRTCYNETKSREYEDSRKEVIYKERRLIVVRIVLAMTRC